MFRIFLLIFVQFFLIINSFAADCVNLNEAEASELLDLKPHMKDSLLTAYLDPGLIVPLQHSGEGSAERISMNFYTNYFLLVKGKTLFVCSFDDDGRGTVLKVTATDRGVPGSNNGVSELKLIEAIRKIKKSRKYQSGGSIIIKKPGTNSGWEWDI